MKTVNLAKKRKKNYNKSILSEGAEVKSLKKAIDFVILHWRNGYEFDDRKGTENFLRGEFREKCNAFHNNKEGKFYLGAVRLLSDSKNSSDFVNVGKLVKIVASNEEMYVNFDMNLSDIESMEDVNDFVKQFSQNNEVEDSDKVFNDIRNLFKGSYKIVPINSYSQAQKYTEFTNWCICNNRINYNGYTQDGEIHLFFVLYDGFDDIGDTESYYNEVIEKNNLEDYGRYELFKEGYCSWDDPYALSMLAVFVNSENELVSCVGRYNHDVENVPLNLNGYSSRDFEHYFTEKELSYILGGDFKELFPYKTNIKLDDEQTFTMNKIIKNCDMYINERNSYEGNINGKTFTLKRFGNYVICNVNGNYDEDVYVSFIMSPSEEGYEVFKNNVFRTKLNIIEDVLIIPYEASSSLCRSKIVDEDLNVLFDNILCHQNYAFKGKDDKTYMAIKKKSDKYVYNILNINDRKFEFKRNVYKISLVNTNSKDYGSIMNIQEDENGEFKPYICYEHRFLYNEGVMFNGRTFSISEDREIYSFKTLKKIGKKVAYMKDVMSVPSGEFGMSSSMVIVVNDDGFGIIDAYCNEMVKCGELEKYYGKTCGFNGGLGSYSHIKVNGKYHILKVGDDKNGIICTSYTPIRKSDNYFFGTDKNGKYRVYYNYNVEHKLKEVIEDKSRKSLGFDEVKVCGDNGESIVYGLSNGKVFKTNDVIFSYVKDSWEDIKDYKKLYN